VGDAKNLQGGILVLTSLRAADGLVYAVAQGPVVTGGFTAGDASVSHTVNIPRRRSPNGATVERAAPSLTPSLGAAAIAPIRLHHLGAHHRCHQ